MNEYKFIWFLIYMILGVLIVYLCGCFIAWDTNPLNWLLFRTVGGRAFSVILFMAITGASLKNVYDN